MALLFKKMKACVRESGCGDHDGLQEMTTPTMDEEKVRPERVEVRLLDPACSSIGSES